MTARCPSMWQTCSTRFWMVGSMVSKSTRVDCSIAPSTSGLTFRHPGRHQTNSIFRGMRLQEVCENALSALKVVKYGTKSISDGVRDFITGDRMSEWMTLCHTQAGGGACDSSPISTASACSSSIATGLIPRSLLRLENYPDVLKSLIFRAKPPL